MAIVQTCKCGHPGRDHFILAHKGRSGGCKQVGCHCLAYGPAAPPPPPLDPTAARPITPPRRQV